MTAVVIEKITSAITGEPSRSELIRQRREGLAAEKRLQEIGTRLEELFGTRGISRSQMAAAALGHPSEVQEFGRRISKVRGQACGWLGGHTPAAGPAAQGRRGNSKTQPPAPRQPAADRAGVANARPLRDPEDRAEIEGELRELNAERDRLNREYGRLCMPANLEMMMPELDVTAPEISDFYTHTVALAMISRATSGSPRHSCGATSWSGSSTTWTRPSSATTSGTS